jgi:hypothetical protein
MKEFRLETFNNLEDAMMWLENELYELELHHDDIKAEIIYVNLKWRVSVILDGGQLELPVISEYR